MSEKLYLPVSLLLSALILSGTLFLAGTEISNKLSGLTIAGNLQETGTQPNSGAQALAPAQTPPAPNAGQTANQTISLADESKDFAVKLGNDDSSIVKVFPLPVLG